MNGILSNFNNEVSVKNNEFTKQNSSDIFSEMTLIIGVMCNIFQPLIYLSPIKCVSKLSVNNLKAPIYYFIFYFLQSIIWITIAIEKNETALLIANILSAFFFFIYLVLYYVYRFYKDLSKIMITLNVLFIGITATIFIANQFFSYQVKAIIAMIMEISCYLFTLQYLKEIITNNDVSYIDFPITVSIWIVNFFWLIYSSLEMNFVLFIPSLIGVACSSTLLWFNYKLSNTNVIERIKHV